MIAQLQPGGLPWGSYEVLYYSALNGHRSAAGDSGVTAAYVEAVAERLTVGEVMVATCQSQPGGMVAFGSEEARRQWHRHAELERERQVAQLEEPWTAEGAALRVARADGGRVRVTIDGVARLYSPEEITPSPALAPGVLAVWTEIRRRAMALIGSAP